MDSARRAEINGLAEKLHDALELEIPTEVEEAVVRLGGRLEDFQNAFGKDAEAYVRKDGEAFAISIKDVPPNRRRFSLAHEIGHLILHLGYLVDDDLWNSVENVYLDSVRHRSGYNEEEFEAHEFAGAFLMPADEFRRVAQEHFENGYFQIEPIANYFSVSTSAAKTRGRWLGIFSWD